MRVTRNFNSEEFECNCGCDMPYWVRSNTYDLADQLQILRDALKIPIHITNAYRCESHNKAVGGTDNSQHLKGKAADLQIKGIDSKDLYNTIRTFIEERIMLEGGLGLYDNFVHYDIRRTKARWGH
jgi:uncharacterized protein YcbK (DUF882 family)